jgi:hypothetical protein
MRPTVKYPEKSAVAGKKSMAATRPKATGGASAETGMAVKTAVKN